MLIYSSVDPSRLPCRLNYCSFLFIVSSLKRLFDGCTLKSRFTEVRVSNSVWYFKPVSLINDGAQAERFIVVRTILKTVVSHIYDEAEKSAILLIPSTRRCSEEKIDFTTVMPGQLHSFLSSSSLVDHLDVDEKRSGIPQGHQFDSIPIPSWISFFIRFRML